MARIDLAQSLANLKLERDAIALYEALARIEKNPARASAFRTIAANERRHADIWADKLRDLGAPMPRQTGPRLRVRAIVLLARLFGTHAVRDMVQALEGDEEDAYAAQASPEVAAIAADEREHAEIWRRLSADGGNGTPAAAGITVARTDGRAVGRASARLAANQIAASERWHRAGRSGTLRAVIFGVSDGLVSNLALVMGVAGASEGAGNIVLLAGIAGLMAGAFSMAAGEYISMRVQREVFERLIHLEAHEIGSVPEEEREELAEIYERKGVPPALAAQLAEVLMADPEVALETHAREELGLDEGALGSPWAAAGSSFVTFALGALVPLAPFLVAEGSAAVIASAIVSGIAMLAVGGATSYLTGRPVVLSGVRMLAVGAVAAAITFAVGKALDVTIA